MKEKQDVHIVLNFGPKTYRKENTFQIKASWEDNIKMDLNTDKI
jgi:hypothetical protein